jgi:hypothetical protein
LRSRVPPAKLKEVSPKLLLSVAAFAILTIFAAGIASGSGKYEPEDQAQYESLNPHVKAVREKLIREALANLAMFPLRQSIE